MRKRGQSLGVGTNTYPLPGATSQSSKEGKKMEDTPEILRSGSSVDTDILWNPV